MCARVFYGRPDHQEEKRRDPVSAGGRGLRGSSQLHLQVRRQVQQVGVIDTILIKVLLVSLYPLDLDLLQGLS